MADPANEVQQTAFMVVDYTDAHHP